MRPEIQRVARDDDLLLSRWSLWIGRRFEETIPMTKLSHPMISCDPANSWIICGSFKAIEHLEHKRAPLPQRYRRRRDQRSRSVLFLSSHVSTPSIDWAKVRVRVASGHCATCWHNSLHSWQLGHIGLLLSSVDPIFDLPNLTLSTVTLMCI